MRSAAAPEMCVLAPLRAGHNLLSCKLDAEKPSSNSHQCEPKFTFHNFTRFIHIQDGNMLRTDQPLIWQLAGIFPPCAMDACPYDGWAHRYTDRSAGDLLIAGAML